MKKILLLLLVVGFFSCKTGRHKPDPKAIKLNDSAIKLFSSSIDTVQKQAAIDLLNKATIIDSHYLGAYWNKFSFQMDLKQYDKAFETINRIILLNPHDGHMQAFAGNILLIKGDTSASKPYFKASLLLYDKELDTMNEKSMRYNDIAMGKALDLLMLDKQAEGNAILKKLYDNTLDTNYKHMYMQFRNKNKKQLFDEIKSGTSVTN